MMRRYFVISPEWGEVVPVTDEGQGPTEYCRDVVEVEADSRSDARVLGLKLLRERPCYYRWHGYNSDNDFAGLEVEPWVDQETGLAEKGGEHDD
jgi:hypothetical protein